MKPTSSLWLLALIFFPTIVSAQIFGPSNDSSTRVWNIRFILDPGLTTLHAQARDVYHGEQYVYPRNENGTNGDPYWQWADWDTVDNRILDYYKVGSLRLGVLVNLYQNWYVGLNYRGYLVQGYRVLPDNEFRYTYWPFFSLSGSVNYDYAIPAVPRLHIQPTVSLGVYQADPLFEGAGKELSAEGRLGVSFQYSQRKPHQIRVWIAHQWMGYRESEPSLRYEDRTREVATDWNILAAGIGLVYHITIKEDPELYDGPGRSRKQRKADKLDKKQEKLEKKAAKLQKKLNG